MVTIFNQELAQNSKGIATQLRSKDINTEIWLDPESKLDKQLKYADSKGIPYAIILGETEAEANKVTLKGLKSRTQEVLTLDEAIQRLA